MEYKRVKPISYDKGVPKYQASGILNLARVVLPRLAGAAGVAGAAAGAKDYTGPSDQELYDFVFGKRWEAPPIEGYVSYPNYNEIIESQRSNTPIGDIYIPEQHRTAASIPARPIPVSYTDEYRVGDIDYSPGSTVSIGGRKYVVTKDDAGKEELVEVGGGGPSNDNNSNQDPNKKKGWFRDRMENLGKSIGNFATSPKTWAAMAVLTGLGTGIFTDYGKKVAKNTFGIGEDDSSTTVTTTSTDTTTPTTSEESFVPRVSLIARRK